MKRTSLPLLKRRQFVTLLGGAAAAWPVGARGQQGKLRTVGFSAAVRLARSRFLCARFAKA